MVKLWPSADSSSVPSDEEPYSPEIGFSTTPAALVEAVCGSTIVPATTPLVVSSSRVIGAAWLSP